MISNNQHLKNLVSNYSTRLWGLVSLFIFIPVYIHFLGIEAYAVIGFYTLILGIIGFADAGLSSAITKEFASDVQSEFKYSLLILIERVYFIICSCISIIIILFSHTIATKWLKSETIPIENLTLYVKLIGVGVAFQLLSSLYFGALFGLNFQVKANGLQIYWQILKSAGVLGIMFILGNNLLVFFVWQIICNVLYVIALRYQVIQRLKTQNKPFELIFTRIPTHIINYVGGMTLIAIISSINIQADKIIISSIFSLKVFGYYNIASTIAQIPIILAIPLSASIFPLFSKISSQNLQTSLFYTFKKASFIMHCVVFPAFLTILFYTTEIVQLWTGNTIEVLWFEEISYAIRWLSLGSTFLSIQFLPYYLLLAKGKTRYTIGQGVLQILIGLPLLYYLVKTNGISGAGVSWALINLGAMIYLYIIVFKRYFTTGAYGFFLSLFILPLLINFSMIGLCYGLYQVSQLPFYIFVLASVSFSLLLNVSINNRNNKLAIFDYKNIFKLTNE